MKILSTYILIFIILFQVNLSGAESDDSTVIYLTRHGKTFYNEKKLWQGTTDTLLNLDGVKQAVQKAEFFKDMPIDGVYCSPLQRAYLTAQIIATTHNLIAQPRFGLISPWCGATEGMHTDDVHALIDARCNAMTQEERRNSGVLEGLMSPAMITANAETELKTLAQKHPHKTIVAVTHSGVLEGILTMHTDAINESINMSNMAYLKYTFHDGNLELIEISPDITYNVYK